MNPKLAEWSDMVDACLDIPFSQRLEWVKNRLQLDPTSAHSVLNPPPSDEPSGLFISNDSLKIPMFERLMSILNVNDQTNVDIGKKETNVEIGKKEIDVELGENNEIKRQTDM